MEVISPDLPFYDFLWFSGRATVNILDCGSCYFSATHFQALLGVQSKGKSWCAIYLESGAVISLRAHVRTPGLRGQAVNPALGDTRSISCYILSAEGGPHKCLFNSQLIHNNAAGPAKSTKMKKCETIKLKFLGWWQGWKGFRETMCFLSYTFSDHAHGVPLLTVLLCGDRQPDLPGSFRADPACSRPSTESGLARKTWRPVSQMGP